MAELGLGEVVGVILVIAFMALAIYTIKTTMTKGDEIVESEIENKALENARFILQSQLENEVLAVSQTDFKLKRGAGSVFLVGIKNVEYYVSEFYIQIKDTNEKTDADKIFFYKKTPVSLKPGLKEFWTAKLQIPIDMPDGIYIFDIELIREDKMIATKQVMVDVH